MPGTSFRTTHAAIACGLVVLSLASCGGNEMPVDTLAGRKREVLSNLGENIILATYRTFADRAAALETATAAYAASVTPENRAGAQQAWRDAMAIWEEAEVMQIGPAGPTYTVGGMALRDEVYSYPLTNTCRVDQEIVSGGYAEPDAFAAQLVNVRGLGALEYLLFVDSAENTCGATVPINTDGTWAALGTDELAQRRADYAHTLAVLVSRMAVQIRDAWEPAGGDFLAQLQHAGDGSTAYRAAQDGLNALGGALLYVDTFTQGMKIGEPAGIEICTSGATCLTTLESPYSQTSKENVLANLRAFRRIFLGAEPGTDAPGLDDLLNEVGAETAATQVASAIENAITVVEALPGSLEDAITSSPDAVMGAYEAIAEVMRLLKADVFTALNIDVMGVPTDND